jgi:hypothetical protein
MYDSSGMGDLRALRVELLASVKKLTNRGLYQAAKWYDLKVF